MTVRTIPCGAIGSARPVSDGLNLTPDEMRTIYARHHGWEKAGYATLALIFNVERKIIARICRDHSHAQPSARRDDDQGNCVSHKGAK